MIDSPCQKICQLEGEVCIGCHRTIEEIRRWSMFSPSERLHITLRCKAILGKIELLSLQKDPAS